MILYHVCKTIGEEYCEVGHLDKIILCYQVVNDIQILETGKYKFSF